MAPQSQLHPQTAMSLGHLLQKLAGNPKTRARTLGMIKEVEPGYRLPGDVEVANLRAEIKADLAKEKQEEQKQKAQARRAKARSALVDELGEDVVKQIEEGPLKKYPHLEYADAATLFRAENVPVTAHGAPMDDRPMHGQIWEFPDLPGLMADPTKAANDAAYAVIKELRTKR